VHPVGVTNGVPRSNLSKYSEKYTTIHPETNKVAFLLSKTPRGLWGPPEFYFMCTELPSWG